jgi:hypothetical protein
MDNSFIGRPVLQNPMAKYARTQQDLVKLAKGGVSIKTEKMRKHPLCEGGFVIGGPNEERLRRMTEEEVRMCLATLFKGRPTARMWDVKPTMAHHESIVAEQSPELFRMTKDDWARTIASGFARNPDIAGFHLELHDVGTPSASCTIVMYELDEQFESPAVPVDIEVSYRHPW